MNTDRLLLYILFLQDLIIQQSDRNMLCYMIPGRATYVPVTDDEAVDALNTCQEPKSLFLPLNLPMQLPMQRSWRRLWEKTRSSLSTFWKRRPKDCAAIALQRRIFMTKIRDAFKDGKAFIPFLTCGDPDLETTEKLVCAMAEAGADLIELGIPFSDPTAEGPVIQEANVRALSAGTTTDKIFDMVVRIRKTVKISLVFMTYANVVFSYGSERFISKAAEIINGLILPDVPYEEKKNLNRSAKIWSGPDLHDRTNF